MVINTVMADVFKGLVRRKATVDHRFGAGDERGVGSRQERDRAGDLADIGAPAQRCLRNNTAAGLVGVHRCAHTAGADAVDANVLGRQLQAAARVRPSNPALLAAWAE